MERSEPPRQPFQPGGSVEGAVYGRSEGGLQPDRTRGHRRAPIGQLALENGFGNQPNRIYGPPITATRWECP